jgi:hypothetical protein
MEDVNRRKALKMAAVVGAVALGGAQSAAVAQGEDRSLVYGNHGHREWWQNHWWWVMDYDHRYPNGWDERRRCGDTGEHWIRWDAISYIRRRGYCRDLPGKPPWYEVKLKGDVSVERKYSPESKSFIVEKADEIDFGPPDTSSPGESQKK